MGLLVKWVLQPPDHLSEAWINYTHASHANAFNITPHSLLFETGIRQQNITFYNKDSLKAFFPCASAADFPFDIFAATFYLLSRYEEYLSPEQDQHGRFPATASIAYQQKFLDEPIVHHWIQAFQHALRSKFPFLKFRVLHGSLLSVSLMLPFVGSSEHFLMGLILFSLQINSYCMYNHQ